MSYCFLDKVEMTQKAKSIFLGLPYTWIRSNMTAFTKLMENVKLHLSTL